MRKAPCHTCRHGPGIWMIFADTMICEDCRLKTIDYLRELGFGFDHPFIREITTVR